MADDKRHYHSFLLRLWRAKEETGWDWRASLESVETGKLTGFACLEELVAFLRLVTGEAQEPSEGKTLDQPPG